VLLALECCVGGFSVLCWARLVFLCGVVLPVYDLFVFTVVSFIGGVSVRCCVAWCVFLLAVCAYFVVFVLVLCGLWLSYVLYPGLLV